LLELARVAIYIQRIASEHCHRFNSLPSQELLDYYYSTIQIVTSNGTICAEATVEARYPGSLLLVKVEVNSKELESFSKNESSYAQ